MPLVSLAGEVANAFLCACLAGRGEAALVDIGIGSGQQVARLLGALARRDGRPERLAIVGIEPAEKSLRQAESSIEAAARGYPGRLEPGVFVLSEPHSDHETASLVERSRNCWRHFGLVFDVIDRLGLSPAERNAIKERFFAREIDDILGAEEGRRTERHETAEMWLRRLWRAGFRPIEGLEAPALPGPGAGSPIRLVRRDGYLGLASGAEPIVATLAVA